MNNKRILVAMIISCIFLSGCQQQEEEDASGPKCITYGYMAVDSDPDLDNNIREGIVTFNRNNSDYYIEAVRFGGDNMNECIQSMNAAIMSKNPPDIIQLEGKQVLDYSSKGVLYDLSELLDAENAINKGDFVEGILDAYSLDGRIYTIPESFVIHSLYANPGIYEGTTITFNDYVKLVSKGEDLYLEDGIWNCVYPSVANIVENYGADFGNEDFVEMLKYIKACPESEILGVEEEIEFYDSLLAGDVSVVDNGALYKFSDYALICGLLGENLEFVGYPSIDGTPSTVSSYSANICISEKSKFKEQIWEFLSMFYKLSYQVKQYNGDHQIGFPTNAAAFDFIADQEINKQTFVEGGERVASMIGLGRSEEEMKYYPQKPLTTQQVDKIKNVVKGATCSYKYGELELILEEELEPYWKNEKSIDDVLEIINSRVNLYIKEKK